MKSQSQPSAPSYEINCRMCREAAALERLCQVIRIRGFRIAGMSLETAGEHFDIALTLEGNRSITMLKSQLEKLHSVVGIGLGGISEGQASIA